MTAGDRTLIWATSGDLTTVDVALDMSHAVFSRQPEYAALVNGLINRALGRDVLDGIVLATRPAEASVIAPNVVTAGDAGSHAASYSRVSLAGFLLAAAALLLLGDLTYIRRAARALRND